VANPVQRLRYFDSEYLRSYDFTDEQSYHIMMRRLMNMRLHLHGIVYGLAIVMDQDSVLPNGPFFFSVAPGLAIDQTGREILVTAPYSLSNVLTGPGLGPGWYEVWICYQESETGLPAAGYMDCNAPSQYTRFEESFQITLKPLSGPGLAADCGGIRLGTIDLQPGVLGLQITKANGVGRTFVGIRAQRVIAPDEEKDTFDITALSTPVPNKPLPGYLDVYPGMFDRGNVVVKKNLVVGDDFVLDPTQKAPSGLPATGNAKITGDLLLNGSFFGFVNGQWYGLAQYIQSLMPFDIQSGTVNITPPPSVVSNQPANAYQDVESVSAPASKLATVSNTNVLLALSQIGWRSASDLQTDWNGNTNGFILDVTPANKSVTNNQLSFDVQWTLGPVVTVAGKGLLPITSLIVNYIVIYLP
jgi:hypothetical protein